MPAAFARDLALPVKLNQFGLSIGPPMSPLSILLLGSFISNRGLPYPVLASGALASGGRQARDERGGCG
jgi:hypothetical protein